MMFGKSTQTLFLGMLCLVISTTRLVNAADADGLRTGLHVISRGGKFFIYPVGAGLGYRKRVTGQIQYVRELDADGNPLEAHVFDQMNRQVFSVDDAVSDDATLGDEITSSSIFFKTELKERRNGQQTTVGKVGLEMHIIKSGGTLNVNVDDTFDLARDDIKFTLTLSDWIFCEPTLSPCTTNGGQPSGETGEFVEVGMLLTAPGGRSGTRLGPEEVMNNDDSIKYSLDNSDEILVEMAKGVVVDGIATQLLEGYPQLTSGPGQSLIVLRFNKFDATIEYDPTINYSDVLPLLSCTVTGGEQPCADTSGNSDDDDDNDDDDNGQSTNRPRPRPWRTAIHILGRSGQFTLYNQARDRFDEDPVFIAGVDFVREIAADGATVVGRQGPVKHSFETFANQEFEIIRQNETDVYGLEAEETTFVTTLLSGDVEIGTLQLDTFVFTENGTIVTDGGEEFDISEDDVKFNVELKDWLFCTNATCDDAAEYIDVGVNGERSWWISQTH